MKSYQSQVCPDNMTPCTTHHPHPSASPAHLHTVCAWTPCLSAPTLADATEECPTLWHKHTHTLSHMRILIFLSFIMSYCCCIVEKESASNHFGWTGVYHMYPIHTTNETSNTKKTFAAHSYVRFEWTRISSEILKLFLFYSRESDLAFYVCATMWAACSLAFKSVGQVTKRSESRLSEKSIFALEQGT
jgi:hypothetical protein